MRNSSDSNIPNIADYKCAIFDLDGTLLETRPELVAACEGAFAFYDLPFDKNLAWQHCGHGGVAMVQALIPQIQPEQQRLIIAEFLRLYERDLGDNTYWIEGAEGVVRYFVNRGLPVGLVTNKLARYTMPLLERLKLVELFSPIVCRDTFDTCKPEPIGLQACLSQYGLAADEALWFGDSNTDAETGLAARVPTVLLRSGYTPMHEIEGLGQWQVDSLLELVE